MFEYLDLAIDPGIKGELNKILFTCFLLFL